MPKHYINKPFNAGRSGHPIITFFGYHEPTIFYISVSSEIEVSLNECRLESSKLLSTIRDLNEKLTSTKTAYDEIIELESTCSKIDMELAAKLELIEETERHIQVRIQRCIHH
jgi:hypothetical protein